MASDIDRLIDSIQKQFGVENGRPIIGRVSDLPTQHFIPTFSLALGYLLGTGGWPEGKLIEFFGKEGAGKTSTLYLALLDCYKYYNKKKHVALIDIEHRFNADWAATLGLVEHKNLVLVQPPNAETATDIMARLIKSGLIGAIGFDSIGQASNWREQQEYSEQNTMFGGVAGVMTRHVKTIAPLANIYGVTCFYLNQLRDDMEGYHRPMTPGGHAVKHMMSTRIYLRPGTEKYMDKRPGGPIQVGYPIGFKTVKNSFGAPFREVVSDFYNQPSMWLDHAGFDTDKDLQKLGLLLGIVQQAGPYYSWGEVKGQGRDKFFEELHRLDKLDELEQEVRANLRGEPTGSLVEGIELEGADITDPSV